MIVVVIVVMIMIMIIVIMMTVVMLTGVFFMPLALALIMPMNKFMVMVGPVARYPDP